MRARAFGRAEHVIVEQRAPRILLVRRPVAEADQAVQQRGHRRVDEGGGGVPPVIDHGVERVERLDLMPPQGRVDQRVARFKIGDFTDRHRLGKLGEALEIGVIDIDHGDDLPGGCRIEGTGVEIGDLIGGKQGEAPSPDHAHRNVVRHVVMCRRSRAVADPYADQWRMRHELLIGEFQRVRCPQPRQILIDIGRTDEDGRGLRVIERG